jgi:hypothetical protein
MRKSNMLVRASFSFLVGALLASPVLAEDVPEIRDVRGLVRVSGSEGSLLVAITKENEFSGTNICQGDHSKRLVSLESMIVNATGKTTTVNGQKCFEVSSFTVLKTPAGHDALVGMLSQKDGLFQIAAEDGKIYPLATLSDGLRKLDGKKVIVDLRKLDNVTATEVSKTNYKAVFYAEFP